MTFGWEQFTEKLNAQGWRPIPGSLRPVPQGGAVFIARKNGERALGWVGTGIPFEVPPLWGPLELDGGTIGLFAWDERSYAALRRLLPLAPRRCDRPVSFGAGDRLGMATAAQLAALRRYPVFPILAQQSPRELARTGRDFRDVLRTAVLGVLEAGYAGPFGADADHLQEEAQLRAAAEAGYSLYTFDLRRALARGPRAQEALSSTARAVVAELAGRRIAFPGGVYALDEEALWEAARVYEGALEEVVRGAEILKAMGIDADLEVSVDEVETETPPEAHAFVVRYLQRREVELWSLAPRFPGVFEKAVDYEGEVERFAQAVALHHALARSLGGHRLSLHSGSEKFRIFRVFAERTEGHFHIKTSGTTWLQAVRVIARYRPALFADLYALARSALEESRRDYPIALRREDLPEGLPADPEAALAHRAIRQLFHISYGILLARFGAEIRQALVEHEAEHAAAVTGNLERHLEALFEGRESTGVDLLPSPSGEGTGEPEGPGRA
ncbi:tagaturonate epimerase family protein [Thermoflexus sp.]|uniref:tagaturonate epimerase family protein n=1 Tax=Thermoflexus sp. TaxID=1969742 RepID=UPI0025F6E6E1|nr:tagaturonate epimerase family protein [Thermoflexus sp.]MDW8180078.1 tagaturonate epimerase family protein [Anaerolineae bacterium]MCS6964672.1 tagaturonate epimerase family protein [Thermoflexus sp.]MCS7350627.1 tagaturonate epimerase family protein [Thermoflexus sp.]MCX7689701.1 tagaturonate epimerase family protein [Thermoflexus sp.]MDW8185177.1 tagaturonate epimerase family protein [Anaerolineae bacterium]